MITLRVDGMAEALRQIGALSDRRFAAAVATALSRTASALRAEYRGRMPEVFDRPTPYTLNSLFVRPATAEHLEAEVWVKDDRAVSGGGTPATDYLQPHVSGGARRLKRAEQLLRQAGHLPAGYITVPGQGARLDAYGNMQRGQIIQIMSQLRITALAGSTRNLSFTPRSAIAAQRKAGGRFFVIAPGKAAAPGVYQREFLGRNITPVLMFVRGAQYRRRFDFGGIGRAFVAQRLPVELRRAIGDQQRRLGIKGAA